MTPLISVKNLNLKINANNSIINPVKNISFSVKRNHITALVGESGSGKSLTALSLVNLIPANLIQEISGEIIYQKNNLLTLAGQEIRKIRNSDFSFIFQDPLSSLNPTHTIERQIKERKIINQSGGFSKEEIHEQVLELLEKVNLTPAKRFLKRFPHELSGGQRQRVMIAIALANENKLLIADEPTTSLDVTIQREILNLLIQLKNEFSLTIFFITHDLNLVKNLADEIIIMKQGEIVEAGKKSKILENPREEYTRLLFESIPQPLKKRPAGKKEFIEVKGLKVHYPIKSPFLKMVKSYVKAVEGIDFKVSEGRTLGIIGESGSGKTSLLKALLRLVPFEGEITIEATSYHLLKKKTLTKFRRKIQVVFQDPFSSLNPRMSMEEIVCEGLKFYQPKLTPEEIAGELKKVLSDVGLNYEDRNRYPHEFSGGQKQRIALARVIIMKPKLILLDEPTSSLDITFQIQIIELLLKLQAKYQLTYIFISHDIRVIRALADHVLVMKDGKMIEQNLTETIYKKPKENYTRELIKASL